MAVGSLADRVRTYHRTAIGRVVWQQLFAEMLAAGLIHMQAPPAKDKPYSPRSQWTAGNKPNLRLVQHHVVAPPIHYVI